MRAFCLSLVLVVAILAGGLIHAQEPKPQPDVQPQGARTQGPRGPVTPLEIQLVISRYQGEKRISSTPYVLAVNANSAGSQLEMKAEVPVPTATFVPSSPDTKPAPAPLRSFSYRSIGTNIDCLAMSADDGRFEVVVGIDDSSVLANTDGQPPTVADAPVFRNFKSRNRVLLRDGQTRQYTAATDRVNGETVRIDVTLRVVK